LATNIVSSAWLSVKNEYAEGIAPYQAWGSQVSPHIFSTYSHPSSTSFWKASIMDCPDSPLKRCLNLPWGLKNSSTGTLFLGL